MRARLAGVSALALVASLGISTPVQAADDVRLVTRDGVGLQYHWVPKATTPVTGSGATRSDFDGDGVDDIAATSDLSLPTWNSLPYNSTGLVVVRYSSTPRVDYLTGTTEGGGCGCFGRAVATGDFNADGYDDLVIGDSDEVDPGNQTRAGGVWILPGSSTGLVVDAAGHINQRSPGIPGEPENLDRFGVALAAGDINGDGYDDLAIGAEGEAIGSKVEAGSVTVVFGSASGITTTGAQDLYQDQTAVPGASERNDRFGSGLAIGRVNNDRYADLVIGAPLENDMVSPEGSGSVALLWGSAGGVSTSGATSATGWGIYPATGDANTVAWYLGSPLAIGDVNGDGLGEVVVGVPDAQTPGIYGGVLAVFTGRTAGLSDKAVRVISQRTAGIPGEPEQDDRFGARVATGDVTGDGRADVLVSAPGEALGSNTGAGVVTLLKGSAAGLTGTGAQSFDQNDPVIPGGAERDDRFGASIALLNLDGTGGLDAVVAASGEVVSGFDWPSGSTYVFHGSAGGLVPQPTSTNGMDLRTDRLWPHRYGLRLAGPQGEGAYY
ncbi:hypothetical protein [Plantactinospora sp. B5E13]|uniref:hypothetical protein n=1 Tax=unclassified Plantactinospora TaxID=2631981 RepID=UPI00325F6497